MKMSADMPLGTVRALRRCSRFLGEIEIREYAWQLPETLTPTT